MGLGGEAPGVAGVDFMKRCVGMNDSVGENLSGKESTQEVKDQLLCFSKRGNKSLSLFFGGNEQKVPEAC